MNKPFTVGQVYNLVKSLEYFEPITDRLNEIALDWHKQQTRWIPVSDRLPTKEDADESAAIEAALKFAGQKTAELAKMVYKINKALEDKDKELAQFGYDLQNPLRRGYMLAESIVKNVISELPDAP